jgi:hypothetical protein
LLTGKTPWSSLNNSSIIKQEIKTIQVSPPIKLNATSGLFSSSLLRHDVEKRLRSIEDVEIRSAKFFKSIDWDKLLRLEYEPAFVPGKINIVEEDRQESINMYNSIVETNLIYESSSSMKQRSEMKKSYFLGVDDSDDKLISKYVGSDDDEE